MIEEPASDRLLNASAVMAMEWLIIPATIFSTNRKKLKKMPTEPVRMPYAWRTFGLE